MRRPRRRRGRSHLAAPCLPLSPHVPRRRPRDARRSMASTTSCDRSRDPGSLPLVGHRAGACRPSSRWPRLRHRGSATSGRRTAVAYDEAAPPGRQLPGDGLHGVAAATRDDRDRLSAVRRAQDVDDVLHHPDEAFGHVVQGPVGEDDRVLEQPIGIDVGARKSHVRRLPQVRAALSRARAPSYARPGAGRRLGLVSEKAKPPSTGASRTPPSRQQHRLLERDVDADASGSRFSSAATQRAMVHMPCAICREAERLGGDRVEVDRVVVTRHRGVPAAEVTGELPDHAVRLGVREARCPRRRSRRPCRGGGTSRSPPRRSRRRR